MLMYTKKLLFSLCLLASSFIAHSQAQEPTSQPVANTYLEKGTWLIGGNLSYLNVTQKYNITTNPSLGFSNSQTTGLFTGSLSLASMLTNQIALGGKITYINASVFGRSSGDAIIGPMARLYFNNEKSSKAFLLGDAGFNTSGGSASYNVGLGLANFVSNYVSIDITGTYGNNFVLGGIQQSQSANLSVSSFALQVGLQVYLPKKKI
jgi:hypothetical protein